jgi:hypothetical protein
MNMVGHYNDGMEKKTFVVRVEAALQNNVPRNRRENPPLMSSKGDEK